MIRRSVLAIAAGAITLSIAGVTAGTYAAFSDYAVVPGDRAVAATVALGSPNGSPPELHFEDLRPDVPVARSLTVDYDGTVPADLTLEFGPGQDEYCEREDAGRFRPRAGGSLSVTIDGSVTTPVDYCTLLGGDPVLLTRDVAPDTRHDFRVTVTLDAADQRYSELTGIAALTVRASGGFTDYVTGSIEITTAEIAPPARQAVAPAAAPAPRAALPAVPARCTEAGMRFDPDQIVMLRPDQHVWDAAPGRGVDSGPFLVIGTDGDDIITGSGEGDCLVGSAGNDTLIGGARSDVLLGDDGDDLLFGENAPDRLHGGAGTDFCHRGDGPEGKETFTDCETMTPAVGPVVVDVVPPPLTGVAPPGEKPQPKRAAPRLKLAPPATTPPSASPAPPVEKPPEQGPPAEPEPSPGAKQDPPPADPPT